jgi:hypothetical protein
MLEEADATYQTAEFHSSGKLVMGTSNGKLVIHDLILDKQDGEPIRIGGIEQNVTKIQAFVSIEDSPVFLVVIDEKELYIYNDKGRICRQIEYGENGSSYMH